MGVVFSSRCHNHSPTMATELEEQAVQSRKEPGALKNFIAGGVGGVCVVVVGHPLDTIKVARYVYIPCTC